MGRMKKEGGHGIAEWGERGSTDLEEGGGRGRERKRGRGGGEFVQKEDEGQAGMCKELLEQQLQKH